MRPDFAAWSAPDGGRPVELSVLIPAYNEESCLGALVRETACVLHGTGKSFEILVVDDGSSDWTPRLLNDLRAEVAELRAVRLVVNSGQSAALCAACRTGANTTSDNCGAAVDRKRTTAQPTAKPANPRPTATPVG